MAPEKTSWVRTAYIRTTHNSATGSAAETRNHFWSFLARNVHQWKGRHRYIFGACSAADEVVLDFILDRLSRDSTWYEPGQSRVEPRDLCVYFPTSIAETKVARSLERKLDTAGIPHVVRGATFEDCDEAMLWDSDYVLDQLTWNLAFCQNEIWPGNLYRHGMRTANDKKFDYSQVRLRWKQGAYSLQELSGQRRPRGESYYRCCHCSGKCKRNSPCRVTGKTQGNEVHGAFWRLPPNGDKQWRELSSRDIINVYCHSPSGEKSKWRSTALFSGA